MKRVFIGSDFHCGHYVGLTPPEYTGTVPSDAFPSLLKHHTQRKLLWDWFAENVKKSQPFDIALINGDTIDGAGPRSGGTELLTTDRSIQADMAASVIRFINAPVVYMTHGTAYHSGPEEDWETIVAERTDASICDHLNINICGLEISMRHQIGGTASVPSRFTALSNTQIRQLLWSLHDQQPRASLILRSHIHTCKVIGVPGEGWQVWTLPGLQGLGSKYGARAIDGLPIDFGFIVLEVSSATDWTITPHIAPLKMQKAKTVVVE